MEIVAPIIVVAVCAILGIVGLRLVNNQHERRLLTRLFLIAFSVRIVFTVGCYNLGAIDLLGGADDVGWAGSWARSQQWRVNGIPPLATIFDLANSKSNPGFAYYSGLFYYILGIRSQMALACFNCFLSALTVVTIFKVSREFFSEKASSFAAWASIFMPGFLIWSALTIKETWLILLEILTCLFLLLFARRQGFVRFFFILLVFVSLLIAFSLRYYVAYLLLPGVIMVLFTVHSVKPFRAAGIGLFVTILSIVLLQSLKIVQFDLAHLAQAQIDEIVVFRKNISDVSLAGNNSAVILDYDLHTPQGGLMMLFVGGSYLLLSPFPWQMTNVRQLLALPDMLLWWFLVIGFIVPGVLYAWRQRPAILLSTIAFVLPLTIFYALMFGNVGLAYRQRAQLMPFFLVIAAAGYERRYKQRERVARNKRTILVGLLRLKLQQSASAPALSSQEQHQL